MLAPDLSPALPPGPGPTPSSNSLHDLFTALSDPKQYILDHPDGAVAVITGAPFSVIAFMLLAATLTWVAVTFYYKKRIGDLEGRVQFRNDEIASLRRLQKEPTEQTQGKVAKPDKHPNDQATRAFPASPPTNTSQKPKEDSPTAEQVTDCIKHLQGISDPPRIKIVSTVERLPFVRQLVHIFQLANYEVIVHEGSNDYIFPACTLHNVTLLRYRKTNSSHIDRLNYLIISLALYSVMQRVETREFPSSSNNIDYLQIELGGTL